MSEYPTPHTEWTAIIGSDSSKWWVMDEYGECVAAGLLKETAELIVECVNKRKAESRYKACLKRVSELLIGVTGYGHPDNLKLISVKEDFIKTLDGKE